MVAPLTALPMIQAHARKPPTKYELAINFKTAKSIGLTIPESFLLCVDEMSK